MPTPEQEFSKLTEITDYNNVNDDDIFLFQNAAKVPRMAKKQNLLACNQLLCASLTCTHAQILLLHGTPLQIVAAPGPGKAVWAVSAYCLQDFTGGVVYATNTELALIATGGVAQLRSNSLGYSANRIAQFELNGTPTAAQAQILENQDLEVTVSTGNPTGGAAGNFITVTVYYYLINL